MAVQGEQVAHADLVGGGQTALHSHAGGNGAEIKAGMITTSEGSGSVTFNTPFADSNYAIALTCAFGADSNIANWSSRTINGFDVITQNDKGVNVSATVQWIAIPHADP